MTAKLRRPISLALHVTILVGFTITVCFTVLGLAVQSSINRHFAEQDADELSVVAESVRGALNKAAQSLTAQSVFEQELQAHLTSAVSGHHGVYFSVYDNSDEPIYQSKGADLSPVVTNAQMSQTIEASNLYTWQAKGHEYRGAIVPGKIGGSNPYTSLVIAVAANTDFHRSFMAAFSKSLWVMMFIASTLTIAASWLAIRAGHKPLHRLSEEIQNITSEQLHLRLRSDKVPVDLVELVESFNVMIGSIEDVFQRLSHFSADIAHEMRTPITNLTTQTQVALGQTRTNEEYREMLYSNLEEYNRLSAIVRDMLWLAQTDNKSLKLNRSKTNLKAEIETLFEFFDAWADEQGVALSIVGDSLLANVDRNLFQRALSNLISNAIEYTTYGGLVTVTLESVQNKIEISVRNVGAIIPQQHLNHIFDRFYRVDPSRQRTSGNEGIGLGLSIVKSITEAHGGEISAVSAKGTTCFTLIIPQT